MADEGVISQGTAGSGPAPSPGAEPGSTAEKPTAAPAATPSTPGQTSQGPVPYERLQQVIGERNALRAKLEEAAQYLERAWPAYEEAERRRQAEQTPAEAPGEEDRIKALEEKLEARLTAKESELAEYTETMVAEQIKSAIEKDYPQLLGDDRTKKQLLATIISDVDHWERQNRREASPRQRVALARAAAKELSEFLSGHVTAEFERRKNKPVPPPETGAAGAPPRGTVPELPKNPSREQIASSLKAKFERFVGKSAD